MSITPCRDEWKGTMTQRERFDAQMHYRPFDRSVNVEFGYWDENFSEWEIFRKNGITNNNEAHRFFNFDIMPPVAGKTFPATRDHWCQWTFSKALYFRATSV